MMGSRTWHCVVSVSFELGTVLSVFPLSALPITSHFTEKKPRLPPRWVASKVGCLQGGFEIFMGVSHFDV